MAKLNVDTSVVDYLKSTGKDSSFSSRSALAKEYGIANYAGDAAGNVALLNALKKGSAPKTPAKVTNTENATAYINSNQEADQASARNKDEVPVRSSSRSYTDIFNDLTKTLKSGMGDKPEAPNFEATYTRELQKAGIQDLETQLNDLGNEENELRAQFRINKAAEEGKPVAMNVIEGRVGEQERAANERLAVVLRNKEYLTNTLKTKYDIVNNLIKLKGMDYDAASDSYNTQFSQNLQLFNVAKGISDDEKDDIEREQDNARANTQIIYNAIQSGGLNLDEIDSDQKLSITKLEMQSGLPVGFYQSLQNKNPKADIVTSTSREVNGAKYVDVIMRNPDGSLATTSMYVGKTDVGGGSKPSEAETVKGDAKKVSAQLAGRAGDDGYVSPDDYKTARRAWVNAGYNAKDFDTRFAKTYANPDSYDVIGVSTSALD